MSKKRLIIGLISVAFLVLAFVVPKLASAVYNGGGTEINMRMDVSTDGTNWYNFTGDPADGNQTLTANAGDTLIFRLSTWNTGDNPALNLEFQAGINNVDYLEFANDFYDDDYDNNDNAYSGNFAGAITLPDIAANLLQEDAETGLLRVVIKDNIPNNTLLQGSIELTGIDIIGLLPTAYAQGLTESDFRILVRNTGNMEELPITGPDSSLSK